MVHVISDAVRDLLAWLAGVIPVVTFGFAIVGAVTAGEQCALPEAAFAASMPQALR